MALDRAAHVVDLLDVGARALLNGVGQRLDGVGAAHRVDDLGDTGFVGDDLLGAQGDLHRLLGRQGESLVARVGMQRLGAAEDGRHGLDGHPHDVDVRLLGGQAAAGGLGVEAQHLGARVGRPEAVAHDARPQPPCRPELGDFLQEIVVHVEEEGKLRAEGVDVEPGFQRRLDVGDAVGQREGDLLHPR